jgi:signal transduction histidine kinase
MPCPETIAGWCARSLLGRGRRARAASLIAAPPALLLCAAPAGAQAASRPAAEIALWGIGIAMLLALGTACAWLVLRERRQSQRLRQFRLQQRALNDLLDVWQWRSGADHRITGIRPPAGAAAARWSGAALGMPLWEHFPARQAEALRARLEAHSPLEDIDVSIAAADGSGRPGTLRAAALTDAEGCFAGYLGIVREEPAAGRPAASDARAGDTQGTQAMQRVEPQPEQAVQVEQADESFMYTLSHDLRAPIRVIEGFARILKEDYGRTIDRIGNDHIDRVLGAAARMSGMIDALLGLSQLSAKPLERQPVNLSQLAAYVAEDLRRQSPQRRVALHIDPELQVQGDPTLLRMVLENLLGNAWKYTGKRDDAEIWFERNRDERQLVFTVRDNGAGFDMRFADRLFGAFQRLHSATEFQGTGVGLVSVRRIIRRHGGEIWAESAPGQGARFHFTLAPRNGLASDRQA